MIVMNKYSNHGRCALLLLLLLIAALSVAKGSSDREQMPVVSQCRVDLDSRSPFRHAAAARVLDNAREGRSADALSHAIASNRLDLWFDDEFRIDCIVLTLAHIGAKSLDEDNDHELARVLASALPLVTSPVLNELLRWYVFESNGDMSRRIDIARLWMRSLHQTMPVSCGDCGDSYRFDPHSDRHEGAALAMYAALIDGYHRGSASGDIEPVLDDIHRQYTAAGDSTPAQRHRLGEHRESILRWMRNSGM